MWHDHCQIRSRWDHANPRITLSPPYRATGARNLFRQSDLPGTTAAAPASATLYLAYPQFHARGGADDASPRFAQGGAGFRPEARGLDRGAAASFAGSGALQPRHDY